MGEPVQGYQPSDPIDIDEIEIFETASAVGKSPEGYQQPHKSLPIGLSIKDAARVLGISPNTVRTRIKSGELSAGKVKGQTGEQWRVFIGNLPTGYQQSTSSLPIEPQTGINTEVSRLLDIIERQGAKLEAASGQIGYLKSQLEEREKEVMLLSDNQKRPWFRRLVQWLKRQSQ